ncbi:MAG: GntR family transcriptional regulator [Alphaproteobacteria bacterium]|jgi:GntR family transcriptional regulator/GntR family mannosyl-D-glycerate transport/metabolism transcriptional repressor|nr:GntR family transcriptional regulator [Alphaproteobacteria bacterium]
MTVEKKTKIEIIENYIIKNIENNFYKDSGNKIESENQLAKIFNVSRMTARKAIDNLVSRLYLYRIKSYGTYINKQDKKNNIYLNEIIGFQERSNRDKLNHLTKILVAEYITPTNDIKNLLKLNNNEQVFYMERVRYIDDIPAIFEISYAPSNFVSKNLKEEFCKSKYFYAKNNGYYIKEIHKEYQALLPDYKIKNILGIKPQHVVFLQNIISYLDNGVIFEFSKIYYNQDKFRFLEKITN